MDRFVIIQVKKQLKQWFGFAIQKMIETLDRLAVFQARKIVETTLPFSNLENDYNYGQIGCNPSQKNC